MELRDYLRILRRRWMMVVAVALLTLGAAAAFTFTSTPMYQSTAKLILTTTSESDAIQGATFSAQRVASYAEILKYDDVASAVIQNLDLDLDPKELASRVSTEARPDTVNLVVSISDADPAQAQRITQEYAEYAQDIVADYEKLPGAELPLLKVSISQKATTPDSPVSPQPARNLGLGLVLGLLLGVGLAVLRELMDTTVKSAEDVTSATQAPLLGAIAYDPGARSRPLVTDLDSHAPRVEAFRVLRTNIQFIDVDTPNKVFVVTSAVPGEGKTTTAVNLAITLAQAGRRTLLVECDLRRPRATTTLGLDNAIGVTTVLLGKVELADAIQKHEPTDLHVLGSGSIPPNPAELLQSRAMADLLASVREQYDTVIIDAPPLLPVTDAALLTSQSDGAILVIRWGKTTRDQFGTSIDRLGQVGAQPVGVVMNMVPQRRRSTGYGYGYGYAPAAE